MRFLSLFSGIGGFDLGFERAGMVSDSVCEIDLPAQSILSRHFPHVRLFDDVRKVGKDTHERKTIDLICGGFPCQDLSIAGKRAGLTGERSGLWFEFARVIDELEPNWVVIENVPGLLSSNKGQDFAVIIQWMAQRGYGVTWRVLDAQYFGVPQRRRRVFIVGSFGNGRSAEVLFESESGARDNPPSREAGKDIAYELIRNPSHSGDKGDGGINTKMIAQPLRAGRQYSDMGDGQSNVVIGTLSASAGGLNRPAGQGNELDFVVADTLTSSYARNRGAQAGNASKVHNLFAFDANQNLRDLSEDIAPTLLHSGDGEKAHGAYSKLSVAGALQAHSKKHGHAMTTQQAAENNQLVPIANSLTAHTDPSDEPSSDNLVWDSAQITSKEHGSKPSPISQPLNTLSGMMVGVRRLTPTECERLQGFPDGWTDGQSDSARYRQLGNAVAVPVVEWLGRHIMQAENEKQSPS